MDAWSHHIACCRAAGIEAFLRQPLTYDVAVGHHSDELIFLSDWNGAYVMLAHQFREFDDGGVGTNPFNALVHRFFDFHGRPPLVEDAPPKLLEVNAGTYGILPTTNGKDDWTEVQSSLTRECLLYSDPTKQHHEKVG